MKLKKGSKEAREFMAKIRGKKKGPKKAVKKRAPKKVVKKVATKKVVKKIAGEKHTDIKSHNYKISISGTENFLKNELKYNYIAFKDTQERLANYQENLRRVMYSIENAKKMGFHKQTILDLKESEKRYKSLIKETKTHLNKLKKLL